MRGRVRGCRLLGAVLAVWFLLPPGLPWASRPLDELIDGVARETLDRGDPAAAADQILTWTTRHPDAEQDVELQLLLARAFEDWGLKPKAEKLLADLSRRRLDSAEQRRVLLELGKIRAERSDCPRAIAAWELVQKDPSTNEAIESFYRSGLCAAALGHDDLAVRFFDRVPPAGADYPFAVYAKGQSLFRLGKNDEAAAVFSRLMEPDAGGDPMRRRLAEKSRLTFGQLLLERGNPDRAGIILTPIPPSSPFSASARFALGVASVRSSRYAQAIVAFRDAVQHGLPERDAFDARRWIGRSFEELGSASKAVAEFGKSLEEADRLRKEYSTLERVLATFPIDRVLEDEGLLPSAGGPSAYTRRSPSLRMLAVLSDRDLAERIDRYRDLVLLQFNLQSRLSDLRASRDLMESWERTAWSHYWQFQSDRSRFEALLDETRRMEGDLGRYAALFEFRQFTFGKETDRYERTLPGSQGKQNDLEYIGRRKKILGDIVETLPERAGRLRTAIREGRAALIPIRAREEEIARELPRLHTRIASFRERMASLERRLEISIDRAEELRTAMRKNVQTAMAQTLTRRIAEVDQETALLRLSIARALDRAASPSAGERP